MYKTYSEIYLYKNMLSFYQDSNNPKNLILEPMCCIIKLILLQFKEKGTKISVSNNALYYNEPSIGQGIIRHLSGDCRGDASQYLSSFSKSYRLVNPLDKYESYYEECKKGLELLKGVYKDNTTMHHTLSHYIYQL